MSEVKNVFQLQNSFLSIAKPDRNRSRRTVFYGRVSTEHEAQMAALENQIEWYDDQAKLHDNWIIVDKYIDEGITGTQAKKRPSFLRMLDDARKGKFDLIVTREVCRFARNTVDTLVVTRELKNLGIEVYFVEDNIWTLDGDGELRLTIMATLAQEESRKVSERVKAGQHISREKSTIYGNGNILGYDKVGHTYVINKEQAETVRMIYDIYLEGKLGATGIANELIRRGRLTATGNLKWTRSNVARILNNTTYMGVIAYGKSFSNNYLEQKRINNHKADTYLYKKGDFEPIISEEVFYKAQEIKEKRTAIVRNGMVRKTPFGEETPITGRPESQDKWNKRLKCACGASLRRNRWHKNKGMPWSYGYQCYNQLNNGSAKKHRELGESDEGYCDVTMVADWKLECTGNAIFKEVWKDRSAAIEEACDIIKKCYKVHNKMEDKTVELNVKLSRIKAKMRNLRDMRLENDIDTDEFHERMKSLLDEEAAVNSEIEKVSKMPKEKEPDDSLNMDKIKAALERMVDISDGEDISEELVEAFVARIVVGPDNHFTWYLNLSEKDVFEVGAIVAGRKRKATVSITDDKENFFV